MGELAPKESGHSTKPGSKHEQCIRLWDSKRCASCSNVTNTLAHLTAGRVDCLRSRATDHSLRLQHPGDSSAESVS
jgi:hypothetical protein